MTATFKYCDPKIAMTKGIPKYPVFAEPTDAANKLRSERAGNTEPIKQYIRASIEATVKNITGSNKYLLPGGIVANELNTTTGAQNK